MKRNFKAASFQSAKIHQQLWWKIWLSGVLLIAGCTSAPLAPNAPPPTTSAPPATTTLFVGHATDEEAVTALILAERQATLAQDIAVLGQLWAANAQIVDGRNSVITTDDYLWQGRAAILDRYQVAVFPFVLPPLPSLDASATITITGDRATVQHGTDLWQLVKLDDRWWLTELKYSYQ